MDAIILAAGRGERLNGYVPPYYKPLVIVNGRSLLVGAIEAAAEYCERIIVVVAPENSQPIAALLRDSGWADRCRIVVQPVASGPGGALLLGAELVHSDDLLVMCGDNTFRALDVGRIHAAQGDPVVGIRLMDGLEAKNFTLFTRKIEAVEKPDDAELQALRWEDGRFRAWLGPLRVSKEWLDENREHLGEFIGPHLSDATLVEVDSYDVGLPERLP